MPVETGDYINSLDITQPADSEAKKFGAGYFRFFKKVVKQSFPNITGAMTATHTVLNNLTTALVPASATVVNAAAVVNEAKATNIASAGSIDLAAVIGNFVEITGTTTITALGTVQAGAKRLLLFQGILTLTHNATSLILPSGLNITTKANDVVEFLSLGGGNWRLIHYYRAAGSIPYCEPGHRLSLTTAVPVTTADVTIAATIYWTPWKHNLSPVYTGSSGWDIIPIAEKSFALNSNAAHTGYHQGGKNFDVWLDYNAGTPRIGTGSAWTNDTTQADVVSRDATYGYRVNSGSVTFRFGTAAGDTVAKSAGTLLWLGTIRATADGQTEDSLVKRFCWNVYNRRPRVVRKIVATDSWSSNVTVRRQWNSDTANQIEYVRGLDEDAVDLECKLMGNSGAAGNLAAVGWSLDSISAFAANSLHPLNTSHNAATNFYECSGSYFGYPGIGYHYQALIEYTSAASTWAPSGDNGDPDNAQSGGGGMILA